MTTRETLATRVRGIMAEVLDVPPAKIEPGTSPETLAEWNSFSHTILVGALESEFGIEFDIDDLIELQSLEKIVSTLIARYHVA